MQPISIPNDCDYTDTRPQPIFNQLNYWDLKTSTRKYNKKPANNMNESTAMRRNNDVAYGETTLSPRIRSRFVHDINGLTIHILEAGYEVTGRPYILLAS